MSLIHIYSLKVWLTSVGIAFLLTLAPLYYFFHDRFGMEGNSYSTLCFETAIEWLKALVLLIIPWLLVFKCVKLLYKPEWSLPDFKWVILLVSEFLTIFFLLDCISLFNASLLMPTSIMLGIFAVSNAICVLIYDAKPIFNQLHMQVKELE